MLKKPVIYKRGRRIVKTDDVLGFSVLSVLELTWLVLTGCISYWWKWRHWEATILQLHSLGPTSDFLLSILRNTMCWQQHLPGNSLEKNGHTDNKISRADFQEAGVEDWRLCRLPICTTSPVLLILKTLSLSGNYLLWLRSGLPDPISTWPKAIPHTAGSPLNTTQFLIRVLKK